jgi:hypothetical protein
MDTIIYIIIGIFVLLYIIDKKELVKLDIEKLTVDGTVETVKPVLSFEEKKRKKRNDIYKGVLNTLKEQNPLKTDRVWTYVEIPNDSINIQLSYQKLKIPVYFQKCIDLMKQNVPELIILTPLNIIEYLPNFSIEMKKESDIPLKLRVDILFATILKEYGGVCVSPGTIVYDISQPLSLLSKYEVVTFGGNPRVIQSQNHIYYPNTYIIGAQKGSTVITEYLRYMLLLQENDYHYNIKTSSSSDVLSELLKLHKPTQYHFGTEYDGTYNSKFQTISLKNYMGTSNIDFLNKDKLMIISFPYDILLKTSQYQWFLNLSGIQFVESNLVLQRLLLKDI